MINSMLKWIGVVFCGGVGVIVGGWITNQNDPVQFLSRKVLTPVVKPGDAIKIELDNYRLQRCAQTTYRILSRPDGERVTAVEDKPAAFGRLGRDKYIASIETPQGLPYGKASLYSFTQRKCNPWEYMFPVTYGEWTDDIEFGPETTRVSADKAKNTLIK